MNSPPCSLQTTAEPDWQTLQIFFKCSLLFAFGPIDFCLYFKLGEVVLCSKMSSLVWKLMSLFKRQERRGAAEILWVNSITNMFWTATVSGLQDWTESGVDRHSHPLSAATWLYYEVKTSGTERSTASHHWKVGDAVKETAAGMVFCSEPPEAKRGIQKAL